MLDYIKYRRQIGKLFRRRKSLYETYAKEIAKAKKEQKGIHEIDQIEAEAHFENRMINEEISILVTNHLLARANLKFLPVPPHTEEGVWEKCEFNDNRYVLTKAGITELRASLRSERIERNEMVIKVLTAITGIIGAATGFLAVWFKK